MRDTSELRPPDFDGVLRAREVIAPHLSVTPTHAYPELSRAFGCEVFVKHENHQPVGSFKVRGGVNLLASLSDDERRRGVASATRGNHGLSLAFAAQRFDSRAVIAVPRGNNPEKNAAMLAWGADLREYGADFDEAREHVDHLVESEGLRFVHSANEPDLIEGVGTQAVELFEQVEHLDHLIVPVGLGSGICGSAIVRDAVSPDTRIIGVQAERAPSIYESWKTGELVTTESADTFADGLATRVPASLTLELIRARVDDFVTVSESAMEQAIRDLLRYTHNLAEGAGAASLAALAKLGDAVRGARVGIVLSGGNIDGATLRRVLALGLVLLLWVGPDARAQLAAPDAAATLGPAVLHTDGTYRNRDPLIMGGGVFLRLGFFGRRFATSIFGRSGAPERVESGAAAVRAGPPARGAARLTWVGHATFLVEMNGAAFLTDPTWASRASPVPGMGPRRFVDPGIPLDDLPKIDFVFVSHNHYDHLDKSTLGRLAERDPSTRFLVPMGNAKLVRSAGVERVEEMNWGDSVDIAGVRVYCLPAQHWSQRGLRDGARALWSSWAVLSPDHRVYHAGDTGAGSHFAAIARVLGPFDVAMLPIGAYRPVEMMKPVHLNPEEAVEAGRQLRTQRSVAMHYGTFDLADEPLDEPPLRFLEASKQGAPEPWVLAIGESREF